MRQTSCVITGIQVHDIRFPSLHREGSDALHPDPNYSLAYVTLHTSDPLFSGHGFTFTLGRGNELCVRAIEALSPQLRGASLQALTEQMGTVWSSLAEESQLRWVGPEKGVIHLATAALMNAVWDLWARYEHQPLWKLLASLSPDQMIQSLCPRYVSEFLRTADVLEILQRQSSQRARQETWLCKEGYPAYLTSAGWLGYSDQDLRQHCRRARAEGWPAMKVKVGGNPAEDWRRLTIVREEIGPRVLLMLDANQAWDVPEAIGRMRELAHFRPFWIEEPTSPDDLLGHRTIRTAIAPIGVASGEHCPNRVMVKQFLEVQSLDYCQLDCCRLGGINEYLTALFMAAKAGVPVCPHTGGVGLGEIAQHLAIFDAHCVSGSLEGRWLEYLEHHHEFFAAPPQMKNCRYSMPQHPGCSTELLPGVIERYAFPHGTFWREASRCKRLSS